MKQKKCIKKKQKSNSLFSPNLSFQGFFFITDFLSLQVFLITLMYVDVCFQFCFYFVIWCYKTGLTAEPCLRLSRWRELNTGIRPTNHHCAASGSKWRHQSEIGILISGTFGLHFLQWETDTCLYKWTGGRTLFAWHQKKQNKTTENKGVSVTQVRIYPRAFGTKNLSIQYATQYRVHYETCCNILKYSLKMLKQSWYIINFVS